MTVLSSISQWVDTFRYFLESEHCPPHNVPIIIWSYHYYPEKYILYNSEQLTVKKKLSELLQKLKDPRILEIWDYSSANVNILKEYGYTVKHIPPNSPSWYIQILKGYIGDPNYDVGFCGAISERRSIILNKLKELNVSVLITEDYGNIRDMKLAQCKILLNIHCDSDFNIFESARCEPWLKCGIPVISENSLDNDSRCINCPYEDLVNTTLHVLSNNSLH